MENQKSALGLDANVTAALGYIIGIIALIMVFIEKDNKFVRFHAIQSLLWGVLMTIAIIAIMIVGAIIGVVGAMASSSLGSIIGLLLMLVYLVWLVGLVGGLIYAAIKAYGGAMFKLPVIGNFAEKWSN